MTKAATSSFLFQLHDRHVVDPRLPRDVNATTLSCTFFEVSGADRAKG